MSTNTILSLSLASLILAVLLVRRLWLSAELERYGLNALYYCHKKQLSVVTADEMSQFWPLYHMLFEVWHWDFSRYIVHQDHLADMNAFIAEELERKDLDLEMFEVHSAAPPVQPPAAPEDKTPPTSTP